MDINSDVAGQVFFDGFDVDEKKDRQGNISRTANRSGIVWVIAGDVWLKQWLFVNMVVKLDLVLI